MRNKLNWVVVSILLVVGCQKKSSPEKMFLLGKNIEDVRSEFLAEGFYVSSIVDQTKEGQKLTMSVELKESTVIDSLSYAAEVNLTPWKEGQKTHLLIRSNMDGKITNVELR